MAVNVASGSSENYSGSGSSGSKVAMINIETMRLTVSSFAARVQSRVSVDTLRPMTMFLGLNPGAGFCFNSQAFTPPVKKMDKGTPEKVKSRVKLNLTFFLSNYVLLAATVAVTVALMHPGMVFFLAIVYGLWMLHSFLLRNQLVLFGIHVHSLLTVQHRFYLLFTITCIVVVWKCLMPTLMFLAISGVLILSHAFLRDPKDVEASSDLLGNESDEDLEGGAESGGSSGSEVIVDRPEGGPLSLSRRGTKN